MRNFTKFMLIFFGIITLAINARAQFQTGDVFVAVASGSVQWRTPAGALVQTLNTGQGGFTTGMSFDSAGSLYVTNFSANTISRFDINGNLIAGNFGGGYSTPEMIIFDSSHNAWVGNIGSGGFRKFDALGNFLGVRANGTRVDFMDLQPDQSTMLYTQEGSSILRWDVVNDVALTPFASSLGGNAYALRIRPNGDVLVANGANILRLNSAGAIIQTYDVAGENSWFAINLAPDGTSFWSADFGTANVYRIDIATGAVISTFNTGTGSSTVFGLAVKGEITVANQLFISVAPKNSTNPINTQHCITATVVNQNGAAQANLNIIFTVRGVNGVIGGSAFTNASGQAQFCYVGPNAGRDSIYAAIGTTGIQDTAFKLWEDALPVELSSFTSSIDKKDVLLKWSTSEELNNSGFDIERSTLNSEYSKVGFVQGNGTTTEVKNYEFRDRNLSSGKYNYRLKQVDFNGNYHYYNLSNEIEIGRPEKFNLTQNYPNPFNPSTKIGFELPFDGNVKLSVYNNSGKLVSSISEGFKSAGYYTIDFNAVNLASGVYFYKMEYSSNGSTLEKVMKMTVLK